MTTGEKIRELRLKKGYTQEELGRLIGVLSVTHPNTRVTIFRIAI